MGALVIADAVLRRARQLGGNPDADTLLTGRAALLGLASAGRVSAGGATRMLRTVDGWCALTLSRDDDVAAVPAMLEQDHPDADPWPSIHRWAAERTAAAVSARARLLDLPVAVLGEVAAEPPRVQAIGTPTTARSPADLLVVDLTSMWAGPLCGQLLARAGAVVVKVESANRPDGTRAGDRRFFDWMNSGKLSYCADFDRDRAQLMALLGAADVVLEGSRPAALIRRGLGPRDCAARPGRIWLRVTGYGTAPDDAGRVAFGDDAAVAGGLVCHDDDGPVFMGDAIADPLTGLESFRAVQDSLGRGGGELIELSMAAVAASHAIEAQQCGTLAPGTPPDIPVPASDLGADNAAVRQIVAERSSATC